jgi:hypothetical protein
VKIHPYIQGSTIDYDRPAEDAKAWAAGLLARAKLSGLFLDWKRYDEAAEFHQLAVLRCEKAKQAKARMATVK